MRIPVSIRQCNHDNTHDFTPWVRAMSGQRPIVAYQLSLLGDEPKPGRAWRRGFWQIWLGDLAFPVSDDAVRQAKLLTSETRSFDADGAR